MPLSLLERKGIVRRVPRMETQASGIYKYTVGKASKEDRRKLKRA